MSPNALYNSLLRPSILHILRAAGFHATRPAVLDTLVDIAIRYLTFLATKTASHALMNRNDPTPTIMDVRMALQDAGSLYPQISVMEEQCREEEDLRGVKAFIDWMQGEANHEIRRIAGLANTPGEPVVDINALETAKEDFLTGKPFLGGGKNPPKIKSMRPPSVPDRPTQGTDMEHEINLQY